MRQLKLEDVKSHGIPCEPAPAPIFSIPPPGPDGFLPDNAVIAVTTLREFNTETEAFAFLADKKGLMILDTPPAALTLMAEAQDWRPGVFIKCWWPGADEEKSGRLGNPSDKAIVETLRCETLLAQLRAEGKEQTDQANYLKARIEKVRPNLTPDESAEVARRLPLLAEWAERCERDRQAFQARRSQSATQTP